LDFYKICAGLENIYVSHMSKVQELWELSEALKNRDKMKDDALAQLSDQVIALTARMKEQ
jgi:hypothetical protein